ncbi:MAG: peptidase prolyl oligopeptidase active site domain protein [Firmicutes bacterium]|nr:peptidase prolyl oligopeptidase active site domain protein [Bacillota bacterium]
MTTEPLLVDDYLQLQLPDDAQISPDGRWVAYVQAAMAKEGADKPVRNQLWITAADGNAARPLTAGASQDKAPRWAPAGDRLAFLSDRGEPGKGFQIYLLPMAGGEATALTSVKGRIAEIAWCRDGRHIAFTMADPAPEAQGDVIHFEEHPLFQRLYMVDAATGDVRGLSPEGVQVWEFAESASGEEFAVVASAAPWEWSWYEAWVGRVPAAGGPIAEVCRVAGRQVASPVWSPDGQQIAFLAGALSDRGSVGAGLWVVPASGGEVRHVTEGYEGSCTWLVWQEPRHLLFMGYEGLEATIGRVRLDGKVELLYKAEVGFGPRWQPRFSLDRSGTHLATVREDLRNLPEVWVTDLAAAKLDWQRCSDVNPQAAAMERGAARIIRWQAPDGMAIEGVLLTPPDWEQGASGAPTGGEAGGPLPLAVIVHGGPTALYGARTSWLWAPYLATRGVAVLMPNPRGSTGRGLAFAEANLGDMGGADLQDILAGVDACIEMGVADPDRLGIGGWSYGGYMTAWATTQTDRFKAAVVGAGICNWTSFHGTSEIPTWDAAYLKDQPYGGEAYRRWSPLTHVAEVKAATLILHGEQDTCVPVGQAYEWFRALKEHGVKTFLRVYPREPHGPRERAHVKDMQEAAVAWLVAHLKV